MIQEELAHLARHHAAQRDRAHGEASQVQQPQASALAQPADLMVPTLPQLQLHLVRGWRAGWGLGWEWTWVGLRAAVVVEERARARLGVGLGVGLGVYGAGLGQARLGARHTSVSQPSCGMYGGTSSPVAREGRGCRASRSTSRSCATRASSFRSSSVYSAARSAQLARVAGGAEGEGKGEGVGADAGGSQVTAKAAARAKVVVVVRVGVGIRVNARVRVRMGLWLWLG